MTKLDEIKFQVESYVEKVGLFWGFLKTCKSRIPFYSYMDVDMILLQSTRRTGKLDLHFYRPQTKLRKGNVFTSVCQEFCQQGGGGQCPDPGPGGGSAWGGCPGPGGAQAQGGVQAQVSRPSRWALLWMVRILLECILVPFELYQSLATRILDFFRNKIAFQ